MEHSLGPLDGYGRYKGGSTNYTKTCWKAKVENALVNGMKVVRAVRKDTWEERPCRWAGCQGDQRAASAVGEDPSEAGSECIQVVGTPLFPHVVNGEQSLASDLLVGPSTSE